MELAPVAIEVNKLYKEHHIDEMARTKLYNSLSSISREVASLRSAKIAIGTDLEEKISGFDEEINHEFYGTIACSTRT